MKRIVFLLALVFLTNLFFSGKPAYSLVPKKAPERERQATIIRKNVLSALIRDAERLGQIEGANLIEDKEKRQILKDGRMLLFFSLHDLRYKVELTPRGKVISFVRDYQWWEIVLAGLGLVALGFAAGAASR